MSQGAEGDRGSLSGRFDSDLIDARVAEIDRWIDCAGDSLQTFFIEEKGGFRRSTLSEDEDSATSTCRALLAMVEQRRVWLERGRDVEELDRKLTLAANHWIAPMGAADSLETLRRRSGNDVNDFTDAQLLTVASLAPGLAPLLPESDLAEKVQSIGEATRGLARDLSSRLIEQGGGSMEPKQGRGPVHDFITMHAVRGVDAHADAFGEQDMSWSGALPDRIQERALGQLAYFSADVLSRYDPAELLFSAALLRRFGTSNCGELTRRAVEIASGSQTDDGAWPSSRIVSYEKSRLLHVASYEVALTMAIVAYREITSPGPPDEQLLATAMESLDKSMRLVRSGHVVVGGYAGWANDRTRWEGLVEGWATAIVLLFLVRYREVLLAVQQRRILQHYRSARPESAPPRWPELDWSMRVPGEPDARPLGPSSYSDPSDNRALADGLTERVLRPIAEDAVERPSDSGAALLLYGKPGTRKTSLVKRLAESLGWPIVTLSPPSFLSDGGLEGFEASADRIFRDLMRIRRCVVLFDECEDFFKPRDSGNGDDGTGGERVESRTIGAFLTAGMLPRLQDLRDRRWVIFVLATNSGLQDLDPAVIRPGRFDFAQEIDHPTLDAQLVYVNHHRQHLVDAQRSSLGAALEALNDGDAAQLPFAVIDEVARELAAGRLDADSGAVAAALAAARGRTGPPPLL